MPGPRANAPFLGGIVRRERSPKAQAVADAAGILNRDYAIAVEHRRGGRELALDVEQERCIAGQAEGAFADRRSIVPGEIDRFTIGRAACRDRVCDYLWNPEVAVSYNKKNTNQS